MIKYAQIILMLLCLVVIASQSLADEVLSGDEAVAKRYYQSDSQGTVLLKRQTEVGDQSAILLSDVAELSGEGAEALADLVLIEANQPRHSVTLSQVRDRLSEIEVNWSKLSLRGYQTCEIKNITSELTQSNLIHIASDESDKVAGAEPGTVQEKIEKLLHKVCPFSSDQLVIRFNERDADLLQQESVKQHVEIELRSMEMPGRLPVEVRLYHDNVLDKREVVYVDCIRQLKMVVTTGVVARGDTITRNDVELRQVTLEAGSAVPMMTLDEVVGKSAKAMLRPNTPITERLVETPLAIKRGDRVTIEARAGSLLVRTEGRALEDGSKGDVIRVRSERTREELRVLVVSYRRVRTVTFSAESTEVEDE